MTESVNIATAPVERRAWSPREIAAQLGIKYKSVLRLIQSGELGALKVGQHYIVPVIELERYLCSARPAAQDGAR